MKTQVKVTELDATKLANLRLRQQLLNNEGQAFERELFATYGNPGEDFKVGGDGSITRVPAATPAPGEKAPKGKGARKPGGR